MKDILKLGVTLFAICAVAALVLGVTNNITAPVIEERNIQASNEARKIVLSETDEFKELEKFAYQIGFKHAAVGALVRSSYHADEQAHRAGVEA